MPWATSVPSTLVTTPSLALFAVVIAVCNAALSTPGVVAPSTVNADVVAVKVPIVMVTPLPLSAAVNVAPFAGVVVIPSAVKSANATSFVVPPVYVTVTTSPVKSSVSFSL